MKTLAEIFRAALPYYKFSKHCEDPRFSEEYFCNCLEDAWAEDLITRKELFKARNAISEIIGGYFNTLSGYFLEADIDPTPENRIAARSTAKLNTEEFSAYVEQIRAFMASEFGCIIPDPS